MSATNGRYSPTASTVANDIYRIEAVDATEPPRHTPARDALRGAGAALSRRGVLAAKAELCNAALAALIDLCYERDDDGETANVDPDGRLLVALPWGRMGRLAWGLRVQESRALRRVMLARSAAADQVEPLFVYDQDSRCWLLNWTYSTHRAASNYLKARPVTLAEFRAAWRATRTSWAVRNLDGD